MQASEKKKTFYGPDTDNLDLSMTVSIWSVSLLTINHLMHFTMTSGFHMLREIKLILKISTISHMSGFCLQGGGGGGGGEFPPNVSAPPPPKKVFPEKKIKSYFKYWSYLTMMSRHQWRLLMSRNAISANAEHYLFQNFLGEHAPGPFRRPKKFFRDRLPPSPNKKILDRTLHAFQSVSLKCLEISPTTLISV